MSFSWKKDATTRAEWMAQAYRQGVLIAREDDGVSPEEHRKAMWLAVMDTRMVGVPYVEFEAGDNAIYDGPWAAAVEGYLS